MEALDVIEPGLEGGRLRWPEAALARDRAQGNESYPDLEEILMFDPEEGRDDSDPVKS